MSLKAWVAIGILVGSTLGSYIPSIWGDSIFSFSSIIGSFIGGILGIWLGYKISQTLS